MSTLKDITSSIFGEYRRSTPPKIQLIDAFLLYAFAVGVLQFLYMFLAGQFPFNSFLSGLIAAAGFFTFTVCLRLQISNPKDFNDISPERAFADFVICNLVLFFVVITFMG